MLRYFYSTDAVYEQVRATLDAAWGFPNADTKTLTALGPSVSAPHDNKGRVYLVIAGEYCDYEPAATLLPGLLAVGSVVEITEADYIAAFPLAEADWHEPRP
jgi:hypothetical protein